MGNFFRGRSLPAHNRRQGDRYRAENRQRPGVVETATGLQYEVLHQGDGPKPEVLHLLTVHYRGTLINGVEFDSSYGRGVPLDIHLYEVIPGWREGMVLMPVGSRYRFVIPPELAYGNRKMGLLLGPESTLIFDVELLNAEKEKRNTECKQLI
ncbi:MAG: FKBP-type peptidyl-prolyl cis-trans isomerase [Magnetococcales bacterium]|nr:FKBP-type peptidyl-prolyl cis-trans isomerase [Magnetococcales bacterium]